MEVEFILKKYWSFINSLFEYYGKVRYELHKESKIIILDDFKNLFDDLEQDDAENFIEEHAINLAFHNSTLYMIDDLKDEGVKYLNLREFAEALSRLA